MRNVLLVSYYVPPRAGIATTRTRQLIAHLPAFGWNVTVLTARLEGAGPGVIQTPYLDVRESVKRALGIGNKNTHAVFNANRAAHGARRTLRQRIIEGAFNLTNYPDAQMGWLPSGRGTLRDLLAERSFDALLSSAPPFSGNLMIRSVKPRIPWIADFRDLWTGNDAYGTSSARKFFDKRLERWSCAGTTALTTISEPLAAELRALHPGVPVFAIPNAFDDADWREIPFANESRCTIVYAGQLFGGRRDPRPLFDAVGSLLDEGLLRRTDLAIDFYSEAESWLRSEIDERGLADIVRIRGVVPRTEVLRAERSADRCLVLLWDGTAAEGIVTGKIFEYLGARRRIVAIGGPPSCAVDDILLRSRAGRRCLDRASLRSEILAAVHEHNTGQVRVVDEEGLRAFEASSMAQRFAEVLDRAVSGRWESGEPTPLAARV